MDVLIDYTLAASLWVVIGGIFVIIVVRPLILEVCMGGEFMDLNEYQNAAIETAIYPTNLKIPQQLQGLYYTVLGLAGEAGETANKVKKLLRGDFVLDWEHRNKIAHELGGVLWYLAMASIELGYTLEEVAELNLSKLAERKNKGTIKGEGDDR